MIQFLQKYGGFFLVIISVIGLGILLLNNQSDHDLTNQSNITTSSENNVSSFYVFIQGEVSNPSYYEANSTLTIFDIVTLAGGFTENAKIDIEYLLQGVTKNMVITIQSSTEDSQEYYYVDIKGEVLYPGLYQVKVGSRIYDVIECAGGLTKDADSASINLSEKVTDQMVIFIPNQSNANIQYFNVLIQGEIKNPGSYYVNNEMTVLDLVQLAGGYLESADTSLINEEMLLFNGFSLSITEKESQGVEDGIVNINYATLEELMTLKGIGIILGQRIIDYRSENGAFENIEEVMNVSGIKESIYEQIKDDITV